MRPVVNGLEQSFGDQVVFLSIDANAPDGKAAFAYFRLQGHPSYVILSQTGETLWTGLGQQPAGNLESQLSAALGTQ